MGRAITSGSVSGYLLLPSFVPTDLPNLIGWWSADVGVSTSGGNVTAVTDRSGNGNTLLTGAPTIGATAFDPVAFNATGYNSLPSFDFANTTAGTCLYVPSFPMGTGGPASAFFIGQMSSSAGASSAAVAYGVGAGSDVFSADGFGMIMRDSSSAVITAGRNGAFATMSCSTNANHRFGVINDGFVSVMYVDGVAGTPGSSTAATFGTGGNLVIGNRHTAAGPGGGPWQGPISEIIICLATLSAPQIASLDTYLVDKWGA
jgi:hypothetical protein